MGSLKKILIKLDFRQDWIPKFICYIEQIIKRGVVLVLLFGSRAKGEFLMYSDIDLLIVSPNLPDVRERAFYFFSDGLPVQPFVMTPAELEERIEKLDLLLQKSKERFRLQRVKDGWKFGAKEAAAAGI